jgi:hypothetical protein
MRIARNPLQISPPVRDFSEGAWWLIGKCLAVREHRNRELLGEFGRFAMMIAVGYDDSADMTGANQSVQRLAPERNRIDKIPATRRDETG